MPGSKKQLKSLFLGYLLALWDFLQVILTSFFYHVFWKCLQSSVSQSTLHQHWINVLVDTWLTLDRVDTWVIDGLCVDWQWYYWLTLSGMSAKIRTLNRLWTKMSIKCQPWMHLEHMICLFPNEKSTFPNYNFTRIWRT